MIAIFTYWSKPAEVLASKKHSGFPNDYYEVLSMQFAVLRAKKQFSEVHFYTDVLGKIKFVDEGLIEFTEVHVVLDSITGNPKFSSYAKLWVIAQQTMPFIHIDNDVYLMKPLSTSLINTPIFTQSAEPIESAAYPFYNEIFGLTFISINDPVLNAYNLLPLSIRKASNIGIIGGVSVTGGLVDFANAAMGILDAIDTTNYSDANFELVDMYISQYYLTAHYVDMLLMVNYAISDIYDKVEIKNKGYIRPLGVNKSNEVICQRIEKTYFTQL